MTVRPFVTGWRAVLLVASLVLGLAAVLSASALSIPASATSIARYPVNTDVLSAFATGLGAPGVAPPGANVPCTPDAAHPRPVILVHGTFENQNDNWQAAAPLLADNGFCVYTFTYGGTAYSGGVDAIADIAASAKQLATFVAHVRAVTGAATVDLVGHSQGGMMPRYYLRFLGGAASVHQLIGIVPSNGGTTIDGLRTITALVPPVDALLAAGCRACAQQEVGSSFLTRLNGGAPTQSGVRYTVIATTHDEVVTPYTNAFLPPSANVTNVLWQSVCPHDPVGHVGSVYDTGILQYVMNTLSPSTAKKIDCVTGFGL